MYNVNAILLRGFYDLIQGNDPINGKMKFKAIFCSEATIKRSNSRLEVNTIYVYTATMKGSSNKQQLGK